jgi:hypothetical protein
LTEITSIEFVPINLTTISELQISAFPKGEEFWLTMHELPKTFSQVILETTNVKRRTSNVERQTSKSILERAWPFQRDRQHITANQAENAIVILIQVKAMST